MSTVLIGDGLCACGCGGVTPLVPLRGHARAIAGKPRRFLHGHNRRGQPWPESRRVPLEQRFWAKVDATGGLDACWPWTGNRLMRGYGVITSDDGKRLLAHRVSLAMSLGRPLGDGLGALHHCDNPPCVNPAHLYEGTHAENMTDMWRRIRRPQRAAT